MTGALLLVLLLGGAPLTAPRVADCLAQLPDALPPPARLCVRAAVLASLEAPGERHLALLVDLPADPARRGLFVYRVRGRALVPRFLGTGFPERALTGLATDGDALLVQTDRGPLRCRLQNFPLVCEEASR